MGVAFTGPVGAVGKPFDFPNQEFSPKPLVSPRPTFSPKPERSFEPKESPKDGTKVSCDARLSAIKTRSGSLVKLANDILTKFDSIVLGVESYYTGKVVPSGQTVSNYADLVKDIQAKKAVVQKDLSQASTDLAGFNCTTGDAKTLLVKFNQDMRDVKSALAEYRTSIKNLIVAVRGVVGGTEGGKPSGSPRSFSPKPFRTPSESFRPFPTKSPFPRETFFPVGKRSPGPAVNPQ